MEKVNIVCPFCGPLAAQAKESLNGSYRKYDQILRKLMELERQGCMELFAGDCPLEDTDAVLNSEQHYTVCHYVRCRRCGALYFLGACIRGTPVFRQVEDIQKENPDSRLWGQCGTCFCRRNAETGVNANAAKHPKKVLKSITRFYVHTQKIRATVGCPDFWYILTQKMFLVVASHPRITVYLNHTDLRKRSDSELQGDNHAVFHFSADKVVKTTHYPKGPCMTKHLCMQRKCLT